MYESVAHDRLYFGHRWWPQLAFGRSRQLEPRDHDFRLSNVARKIGVHSRGSFCSFTSRYAQERLPNVFYWYIHVIGN